LFADQVGLSTSRGELFWAGVSGGDEDLVCSGRGAFRWMVGGWLVDGGCASLRFGLMMRWSAKNQHILHWAPVATQLVPGQGPLKKKILGIRKINGCRAVSTNHILSWVCSNISLIIPKQKLIFGKVEENILQWKATKMNCPNTYVFYLSDFMGKRGQSYTFF